MLFDTFIASKMSITNFRFLLVAKLVIKETNDTNPHIINHHLEVTAKTDILCIIQTCLQINVENMPNRTALKYIPNAWHAVHIFVFNLSLKDHKITKL